ncbi:Mu gpG-like protein [Haloarcula tailed virus 3]|uniref:Mu gpG-like protein n=1 Tax=Haloarcula tailed virus 3 TaxID=2877990 RepID=A0AAE9BZD6_9CAUD|nr:Mu gpG-like protein [Haloarcula tailed virus 3]UBF23373.1 Mu gpG-like protein [Haloarcula tailed virus 3]
MTDFDFELDGFEKTKQNFEELRERYDGDGVTYVVGTSVKYGLYLETGTEKMSPRPWFRPAIREFRANPEDFLLENTDFESIDDIETTEELVKSVAFALQSRMEDNVSAGTATNRSPGTKPDSPKRDTGNLVSSLLATRIQ